MFSRALGLGFSYLWSRSYEYSISQAQIVPCCLEKVEVMVISAAPKPNTLYPSSDGEPVAETYDHLYALLITLEVLRQYLDGQQATVLGNQFLYYSQGFPKLRTVPDVMVIFDVVSGGRDS